jgi:hypothetical protein
MTAVEFIDVLPFDVDHDSPLVAKTTSRGAWHRDGA